MEVFIQVFWVVEWDCGDQIVGVRVISPRHSPVTERGVRERGVTERGVTERGVTETRSVSW